MEGSLVAYKVFTNGSVLQASEVNDNLMKQAVATFSNAAARTAAITSPVEGQLTYLEDVNLYQHWNGSAWVSPFGATLINSTNFTAVSSFSPGANTFSSSYDFYKIYINASPSTQLRLNYRFGNGASPDTTSSYTSQVLGYGSSGNSTNATIANTGQNTGSLFDSNQILQAELSVINPFGSGSTSLVGSASGSTSDSIQFASFSIGSRFVGSTSFNTIFFTASTGNLTGSVSVYGMRR